MHRLIAIDGTQIRVEEGLLRVARLEAEKYHFPRDPAAILPGLRNQRPRIDLFTFTQRFSQPDLRYPYPMETENVAALPVCTFDDWWTRQIDNKTRNMVRKGARAGVVVREVPFSDDLVSGIWTIYNECPVRQGRPFRHYGKSLGCVYDELATFLDCSIFLGAFLEGILIGFAKLICDDARTQLGIMSIVSMIGQRDKAPTNTLIAEAVRSCAERRIPHLVYADFAYRKRDKDGVAEFKRNSGFQRVDVSRYYVPLTTAGSIGFRLGLHHRPIEHIPEPVIAKLRTIRAAWYERQLRAWKKAI